MDKNSQEILIIRLILWKNHTKYWSLIWLFSLLSEGYFKLQMLHVVWIKMCSSFSIFVLNSILHILHTWCIIIIWRSRDCWTVFCHIPDIQHFCHLWHHCIVLACVCQGNRQTCIQLHILGKTTAFQSPLHLSQYDWTFFQTDLHHSLSAFVEDCWDQL